MAQLVKTIKTERQPKPFKTGLDELPEVKTTSRSPKLSKTDKKEKHKIRAGKVQMSINLKGKPKIIEDGTKIK